MFLKTDVENNNHFEAVKMLHDEIMLQRMSHTFESIAEVKLHIVTEQHSGNGM